MRSRTRWLALLLAVLVGGFTLVSVWAFPAAHFTGSAQPDDAPHHFHIPVIALGAPQAAGAADPTTAPPATAPMPPPTSAAGPPVARSELLLDISYHNIRTGETNAGNLLTDAYLSAYDQRAGAAQVPPRGAGNPVIGIQSAGIFQGDGALPRGGSVPGPIAEQDVYAALPSRDAIIIIPSITPLDLKIILEHSVAGLPLPSDQFVHVAGINVTYNISATVGSRIIDATLADGMPLLRAGATVDGAPNISVITAGSIHRLLDARPHQAALTAADRAPLTPAQALLDYLRGFPTHHGAPTIRADDPRYQPVGAGRIHIAGFAPAAPAPECDPEADLTGTLISDSLGRVTNRSATCAYDIGLASYRRLDRHVKHQELFDWSTIVIRPGQTIDLTVGLPGCAAQIDLFYGALLLSLDGQRYGTRILASRFIGGDDYCAPAGTPSPTPMLPPPTTSTPTSTPTSSTTPTNTPPTSPTPTRTPTPTVGPG
jgi:hypothetical protein